MTNPRLLPAIAWTILIAVLLTIPGSYVPGQAWSYDKVGHFGLFAGFAWLWSRALGVSSRNGIRIAIAGLAYGVGSEFVQDWMPGERVGDPLDALANVLGLGMGLIAAALHARRDLEGDSK